MTTTISKPNIMKAVLMFSLALFVSASVYAEGPVPKKVSSDKVKIEKKGFPDRVSILEVPDITTSAEMETAFSAFLNELNVAQERSASMYYDSQNTFFRGDSENLMRAAWLAERILDNTMKFIEKYAEKDPKAFAMIKEQLGPMKAKLNRVYAYHHGPDRQSFTIEKLSNEGKGTLDIDGRAVRYYIGPGLGATPIDEREVIAVERLPDGTYLKSEGILYRGEESVTMYWDPRIYSYMGWFLDYHNISMLKTPDGYSWLTGGPISSSIVDFSENKTAAKSAILTHGQNLKTRVVRKAVSNKIDDCDC